MSDTEFNARMFIEEGVSLRKCIDDQWGEINKYEICDYMSSIIRRQNILAERLDELKTIKPD